MAVKGFFYNATDPNDKEHRYNGQDMNEDKAPFYKEGVVFGQLQVTADGEKMAVKVDGGPRTGYAYINLHTVHNETVLELDVSGSSGTLPRIDRVILRNDETERRPSIFILEGTFSSNPQPPALTNNDTIQEKCLAEIFVAAGAVAITQADITDTRADPDLCGYIASQFNELDFSQFATQFNAFIEKYRGDLDFKFEDLEEYEINKKAQFDELQTELIYKENALHQQHEKNLDDYISQLKERGDSNLAALTQQLIDFRNTNETKFLEWFEMIKGVFSTDAAAALLLKIEELAEQVEFNNTMITTGKVLTKIATSEGSYVIDSMGNPILAGWPICKCK